MTIPFNIPVILPESRASLTAVMENKKLSGEGPFNKRIEEWMVSHLGAKGAIMTPSCTAALEMAMLISDIGPGDEVIVPSFTFTSTATAVALVGATPVFVDADPQTLNMSIEETQKAITSKTKAILCMHYAAVGCDMEALKKMAEEHGLFLIEDAAQALGASWKNKPLGTWGHLGAFSYHETKNITSGEGGTLLINDQRLIKRAEIIRDKGSNRSAFFRGEIDKYSWVDKGSSYLMSEFQAAYLWPQIEALAHITHKRLQLWNLYDQKLEPFKDKLRTPFIPPESQHNGHIYWILLPTSEEALRVKEAMKQEGITLSAHYNPLHISPAGMKYGRPFASKDNWVATDYAARLLRLPLYYDLSIETAEQILDTLKKHL